MAELKHQVAQFVVEHPHAQKAVASGSIATGLATVFEYLPTALGTLATVVGITLSIMMIRRTAEDIKKTRLEIEILRQKELERLEQAAHSPMRRTDDPH